MKLIISILLAATLTACSQTMIPEYFKQAENICEDRGGANSFRVDVSRQLVRYEVRCRNGDSIVRAVRNN